MSEGEGIALVSEEFLRVLRHEVGVNGDHGDVALVGAIQRIEVGQLLYAGRAVGRPEVDEGDLAPLVREMEGASVVAGDAEILKRLADLAAHRRVAVVAFCGRAFGLGGDFICRGGFRLGRDFDHRRGFRLSWRFGLCGRFGYGDRWERTFCRRPGLPGGSHALFGGGIQHIEPQEREAQRQQRNGPEYPGHPPALFRRVRVIPRAAHLGRFEGDAARLDRDGALVAGRHAPAAVDAFVIAHAAHVHAAAAHARAAVVAAALVHLDADDVEAVEQAVDRAQRTDEAAEGAIAEHAGQPDGQHDDELAGKEHAQHAELRPVDGVRQQAHGPLEGARRADVLAEAGQGYAVGEGIPQRYGHDEHRQQQVFQPRQGPRHGALFNLQRGHFIQKLLDQAQRAQPAADGATQDHAIQHDDAQHVPARPVIGGAQRVLYRPQGARARRRGAGIAVEARRAEVFSLALVDVAGDEALDIGVVQQRRIQLDQPAGGGPVALPPGLGPLPHVLCIIQGQHTPYRS